MAKIALIVGSVRRDRQGIRVTRWLEQKLQTRDHITHFVDPLELTSFAFREKYHRKNNRVFQR